VLSKSHLAIANDQLEGINLLDRSIKSSAPQVAATQKSSLDEISPPPLQRLPAANSSQSRQAASSQVAGQSAYLSSASKPASSKPDLPASPPGALDIDWLTWGLVLLAVITLGGLIPFWVWIYLLYNPPGG
jgi:hypothetical protein